jgi:hypothetical protein
MSSSSCAVKKTFYANICLALAEKLVEAEEKRRSEEANNKSQAKVWLENLKSFSPSSVKFAHAEQ